jgi:hypothetical protein
MSARNIVESSIIPRIGGKNRGEFIGPECDAPHTFKS